MQEKTLFRLALTVTVVGLFLLFVFSEETALPAPETIEGLPQNKQVMMEGLISKLVKKETAYFITLDGVRRETTEVILFPEEDIYLKEGQVVSIQGTVQAYKGKNEIIASQIEVTGEMKNPTAASGGVSKR